MISNHLFSYYFHNKTIKWSFRSSQAKQAHSNNFAAYERLDSELLKKK